MWKAHFKDLVILEKGHTKEMSLNYFWSDIFSISILSRVVLTFFLRFTDQLN